MDRSDHGVVSHFLTEDHDHGACRQAALAAADELCHRRGMRFTRLRRRVLELIWDEGRPVKAYELLERLRGERSGAAPPTVYRTLDFLLREGLVHRVESLNAYIGCGSPGHSHPVQLLVCQGCHQVAELADPEIAQLLQRKARGLGFRTDSAVVELEGVCPRCST
ncbi:MAG: Fur family transcriptional regulator [Halorhodospira sp.]